MFHEYIHRTSERNKAPIFFLFYPLHVFCAKCISRVWQLCPEIHAAIRLPTIISLLASQRSSFWYLVYVVHQVFQRQHHQRHLAQRILTRTGLPVQTRRSIPVSFGDNLVSWHACHVCTTLQIYLWKRLFCLRL